MDIGKPYNLLGTVNVWELSKRVSQLTMADWEARPIRRASLAGAAHNAARSIVMKHEWTPDVSKRGYKTIDDSLRYWCGVKERPVDDMLPLSRQENDQTTVYTFEDWHRWQDLVEPIANQVLSMVPNASNPVLIRALLIRLDGLGVVPYHVDEQKLANVTHRIHVCVSNTPGCIYKVDGHHFNMSPGGVYDFNNKVKHGVENRDHAARLNMMFEVLPNAQHVGPVEELRQRVPLGS